jgi:hypothetical protein
MLGDCFHGGDRYKKNSVELATRDRCKPIHHIRLHGYLTGHTTPIIEGGELTQGWFDRLRSMYKEGCEKKKKKVAE